MFRFAAMLLFYERNYLKTKSSLLLNIYNPQNFKTKTSHLSSLKMESSYSDVRLLKYKPSYDI